MRHAFWVGGGASLASVEHKRKLLLYQDHASDREPLEVGLVETLSETDYST